MPEHQQTQQSKIMNNTFQKQTIIPKQTPISHPAAIIQRARINPKSLTPADVLQLQCTTGNRAVDKLLSEIRLIPSKSKQATPIQMQTIPEEEKEPLQGKMTEPIQLQEKPEEKELLQGKTAGTIQRQEISDENEPLQTKKESNTGMPDYLKDGVENLSGIDMSDVRVHYDSSKPAEVGALAYTQGMDIHLASGEEKHLPHEAWHVVQQKQGRVKSTMKMKGKVNVNHDAGLEKEADVMGRKALHFHVTNQSLIFSHNATNTIQRMRVELPQKVSTEERDYDFGDIIVIDLSSLIAGEIRPEDPSRGYYSERLEISKRHFSDRPEVLAEFDRALELINSPENSYWKQADPGKRVGGEGDDYASVESSVVRITQPDQFLHIRYPEYAQAIVNCSRTFPTMSELSKYNKLREYVESYTATKRDNIKILNLFHWLIPLYDEMVKGIENKESLIRRMKIALNTEIQKHQAAISGKVTGPEKALIRYLTPRDKGIEDTAGVRSEIKTGFLGALKSGEKADPRGLEKKLSIKERRTFVAGHLVADTLGGKNASYNLAPMTNDFNTQGGQNGIKDPEIEALKRLKSGSVIFYRTEITYEDNPDPYEAIKPKSVEIRVADLNIIEEGDPMNIEDYKTVSNEKIYKRTMP